MLGVILNLIKLMDIEEIAGEMADSGYKIHWEI